MKTTNNTISPIPILKIARGFWASQVVIVANELRIFDSLSQNFKTAQQVAKICKVNSDAIERIMNSLVGLGMLKKENNKFSNNELSETFLVKKNSEKYLGDAIHHMYNMWGAWSKLEKAVKTGKSVASVMTGKNLKSKTKDFIYAMQSNASLTANIVAKNINLKNIKNLLDIGGGSGAFSIAFCKENPNLNCVVLDVENVIPLTKKFITNNKLTDRIKTKVGDILSLEHPNSEFDAVLFSHVLHIYNAELNIKILKKIYTWLHPGGMLILHDFFLLEDKTEPVDAALFSLNMLINTKSGRSYSALETMNMLKKTGFKSIEHKKLHAGPSSLIVAYKSKV